MNREHVTLRQARGRIPKKRVLGKKFLTFTQMRAIFSIPEKKHNLVKGSVSKAQEETEII